MSELVVTRWTRYGHDRLYVATADGVRVGCRDLKTGQTTIETADLADAVTEALNAWSVAVPTQPAPPPVESTEQSIVPPTPLAEAAAWQDLAANRPGQAAREQAAAELAAMRERSRVGTFIARTFDMKTDERAWRVGAGGEQTVGVKLEKLAKHGWHVLHAVPVGSRGSDIDHVLVGPGGVFTINTKTHPGKKIWVSPRQVRVGGQPVPYLRNARFEAERAERMLSAATGFPVFVRPAIIFLTGSLIPDVTIKQRPEDVLILDRMDIPGVFKRATQRLQAEQVARVFEVARRSTTWVG